ncbi:MAG: urease accessory UreF family protein [Pseudomonadota bacterium]
MEQAVADGAVKSGNDLRVWMSAQIRSGSLWNDAVFFAQAHHLAAQNASLAELTERAIAMTNARQRLDETLNQGASFREAAAHWVPSKPALPEQTPLPICVGFVCGIEGIDVSQAIAAYVHAFVTNQLQAAIRLSVIGQSGAAEALAALETVIEETAGRAALSKLDDLGTCAFLADIAAMQHETLQPRLFQS